MSARDRLDTYERDWGRHLKWRNLPTHATSGTPGRYVSQGSIGGRYDQAVTFNDMPTDLASRVSKRLEACVAQLVDEEHAKLVEELRVAAVAEAKATLEELGAHVAPATAAWQPEMG